MPAVTIEDVLDIPVLVTAKGTTATDEISPAGPWLRYRGQLDRFGDSMFSSVVNAFTGAMGKGRNVLSGAADQPYSVVTLDYRARGVKCLVVGDTNRGGGGSREHAASSPRLLGGVAAVARSLAGIHETNLKKQGLLSLTFQDPADYGRIHEDDRISLLDLGALVSGRSVTCRVGHADGTAEMLRLQHSCTATELLCFRAAGALNREYGDQ